MTFKSPKAARRFWRIVALCLGVGLLSPSAGSALGMDFVTSVAFGALMTGIGIIAAILISFGVDDGVSDAKFNKILRDKADDAIDKIDEKKK